MKHLFIWSFVLGISCVDRVKELLAEPEEEEDNEEEPRREGDKQGDCLDGVDNDEDGYVDCEDQGCDGKPACLGGDTDTDSEDTGNSEENLPDVDDDGDGYTENEGDCDDLDPTVYPGADDYYGDDWDENCDGVDGTDNDGDGWIEENGDCDDSDASINPDMTDSYGDFEDENCDGVDGNDNDGDGYAGEYDDCDDSNPDIGSVFYDQDCDGAQSDVDCDDDDPERNWQDNDGDGQSTCGGSWYTDCNDNDPTIYAGAPEIPADGIDQDCDGEDYFEPCCYTLNMYDSAGDGWGNGRVILYLANLTGSGNTNVGEFSLSSGSSGSDTFCVDHGREFSLFHYPAAYFNHEISYELRDSLNILLYSASNPATGSGYSATCN